MKTFKYLFLVLLIMPFLISCDEDEKDDEDVQRTTHTVTLKNESGVPGCALGEGFEATFLVTYRDIQVSADINDGSFGIINVLVEDGESINVRVFKTEDDTLFADANVDVRTTSRPEELEEEIRSITFCQAFQLNFQNF